MRATDDLLTNTSAAVLGMVALGARSGYEIQRAAERSVRFFWSLAAPQVYAELKRLEAAGLLAGRDDARGGRPRRVFEATDAGREALRAWLTAGTAPSLELRDGALLRLFFADALESPAAARALVGAMRARSERALEQFEGEIAPAAARAREGGAHFPGHVAAFGRELHEFIVGWCDRLEAELSS
ncbi:MAG TPA: helix-turn-helix transcriptional regulator [Solirubrobacteraceae bacterium]|jgi:DNA-binding PadR family transcriptional regulator